MDENNINNTMENPVTIPEVPNNVTDNATSNPETIKVYTEKITISKRGAMAFAAVLATAGALMAVGKEAGKRVYKKVSDKFDAKREARIAKKNQKVTVAQKDATVEVVEATEA